MVYIILIVAVVAIVCVFLFRHRTKQAPVIEPLDISGWQKIDKKVATEGGFTLSGDAINYGNGRPYKLHLKREADGSNIWYAEMVDTGEWYKTDIGENSDSQGAK